MSEKMIEVEESIVNEAIAGWGESKMELVEGARSDISDAMAILRALRTPCDIDALRSHDDRMLAMALAKLTDAKTRVDICDNELDCERTGIQPITRD